MRVKTTRILYAIAFFLFITDILLKKYILDNPDVIKNIIGKFVQFRLFENTTIAFSLPIPWSKTLTAITAIIFIIVLCVGLRNLYKKHFNAALPWVIIALGALSNLIDRIRFSYVIDYIHIKPASFINIADILISIGVIWLIIKKPKNAPPTCSS